jgi:hypothetical protein
MAQEGNNITTNNDDSHIVERRTVFSSAFILPPGEEHQLVVVLPPRADDSVYTGVITFSASKPIVAAIGHKIEINQSSIGDPALLPPATNVSDITPKIGEGEGLYAVSFYPPFVPPASNNNETAITTIAAGITSGSITFTGNVLLLHSSYPFPPFDDTQPFGVTYTVDAEVRKAGSVSNVSSVINDDSNTITMTANETSSSTIATGQQVTVD